MSGIFHILFYKPLYNGLILLVDALPGASAGVAVILFTIIIKFVLFPFSKKAVETNLKIKDLEPELKKIKEVPDKQEQARQTMALYREKGVNPFLSFFLILIQIPIIFALYRIFLNSLPQVDSALLYSFVRMPEQINMAFLGVNIAQNSLILAGLAGISSFFQIRYSVPPMKSKEKDAKPDLKEDLARSMNVQMRYIFPAIVFLISLKLTGVLALYWITGNLFTLGQEIYLRRKFKKGNN